jgi:hypothetical protein
MYKLATTKQFEKITGFVKKEVIKLNSLILFLCYWNKKALFLQNINPISLAEIIKVSGNATFNLIGY